MIDTMYLERAQIEQKDKWRELIQDIPFIQFPAEWKVQIIPPFGGAVARFRIRLPSGAEKSVYLDWYSRLGCMDEPYWEVYPYQGDCGRAAVNEIPLLLEMIADESKSE